MPLHLLGKKSWNVYNHDNIARVKRDEADAAAREAAEEQAMQEADAARRLRILRGEPVDDDQDEISRDAKSGLVTSLELRDSDGEYRKVKDQADEKPPTELGRDYTYDDLHRKRKRRHGEDDTDRDMRYAKRMLEQSATNLDDTSAGRRRREFKELDDISDGVALVDAGGNINLFPEAERNASRKNAEKYGRGDNRDRDRDRRREKSQRNRDHAHKDRDKRDEYDGTMRFSEAGGRRKDTDQRAWYQSGQGFDDQEQVGRDVWGNEDPGRRQRQNARMAGDDPLAAMMQGVRQVRKVEADRKQWKRERKAEMEMMRNDDDDHRRTERRQKRLKHGNGRKPSRELDKMDENDDVEDLDLGSVGVKEVSRETAVRHERSDDRRHRDRESRQKQRNPDKEKRRSDQQRGSYSRRKDESYGRLSRDD